MPPFQKGCSNGPTSSGGGGELPNRNQNNCQEGKSSPDKSASTSPGDNFWGGGGCSELSNMPSQLEMAQRKLGLSANRKETYRRVGGHLPPALVWKRESPNDPRRPSPGVRSPPAAGGLGRRPPRPRGTSRGSTTAGPPRGPARPARPPAGRGPGPGGRGCRHAPTRRGPALTWGNCRGTGPWRSCSGGQGRH